MEGNGRRRQSKQTNSGLGQGKDRGLQRSHVDSTHTHTHASHLPWHTSERSDVVAAGMTLPADCFGAGPDRPV